MDVFQRLEKYNMTGVVKDSDVELSPEDDFIERIRENGFDMEPIVPILKQTGDQLIISGAGSGKTTLLTMKLQHCILSGEATTVVPMPSGSSRVLDKIWVATFLNSATNDIKERMSRLQAQMGYNRTVDSIKFSTLHAEFMNVLKVMKIPVKIISQDMVRNITKEACKKFYVTNQQTGWMSKEDYKVIESIFTYARNRIDYKRYNHSACKNYGITSTMLDGMISFCKESRRKIGYMDFEDAQEILYEAVKVNVHLQDFLASRYSIIFLDEFQDTSQIQYEVLKYYFKGARKKFIIGDDDQSIYTWRGSDSTIMTSRLLEDFDFTLQYIGTNYRCPSNILNPVIPCIEQNSARFKKELKSSKDGGEFLINMGSGIVDLSNYMLDCVLEARSNNMNIAVVTRTNYDGLIPAILMEYSHKYNYSLSSESMTLSSALAQSILNLGSLFTSRCNSSVKRALETMVSKKGKYQVGELYSAINSTPGASIWTIPIEDIDYSVPELGNIMATLRDMKEYEGEVASFKRLLSYVRAHIFDGDNEYNQGARDMIDIFQYLIEDMKVKSVSEFIDNMREIETQLKAHVKNMDSAKVIICTAHDSKGKQFDYVVQWKLNDGVFPSYQADDGDIEEERRLFYIVVTRAVHKYVGLATYGCVSPFISECDINKSQINYKIAGKM